MFMNDLPDANLFQLPAKINIPERCARFQTGKRGLSCSMFVIELFWYGTRIIKFANIFLENWLIISKTPVCEVAPNKDAPNKSKYRCYLV